jgi:hypothetical protein
LSGRDEWVNGINTWSSEGTALRFEAGEDYVEVSDFDGTSLEFTISLWFIWEDLDSNETQFLIGKGEEHYEIHTGTNNGIMFIPAGHPDTHIYAENVIHSGWNHVVVNYDGELARIYFDGELVSSRDIENAHDLSSDDYPFLFGKRDNHIAPTFSGVMDEVAIWDRALSSEEILDLYNIYDIPVAYWSFDEESGDVAYDGSGNDNDGTLKYGPVWVECSIIIISATIVCNITGFFVKRPVSYRNIINIIQI